MEAKCPNQQVNVVAELMMVVDIQGVVEGNETMKVMLLVLLMMEMDNTDIVADDVVDIYDLLDYPNKSSVVVVVAVVDLNAAVVVGYVI